MKKVIAGIGEVLWDVIDGKKLPGGAPANFAGHFLRNDVRSEYECMVVSAVGRDNDGQRLKKSVFGCRSCSGFFRSRGSLRGVSSEAVERRCARV